ncbi:MAG: UPF0721 transmembrane protein YdhB [Thermomicrobiales bacterium]|nr:MAG: UPF0721 transmembrane protein YdhB [Thermomicrobiales bacterium]
MLVALLTSLFHLPIHEAIGTSLAAMWFVTVAGAVSHFREGNIAPRIGFIVGLAGMVGAIAGARFGQDISPEILKPAAGLALWFLALLVWLRTRITPGAIAAQDEAVPPATLPTVLAGLGIGFSGGAAAAFFGVGMAPFLQLGLLTALRLPLRHAVGTTMLTLVFISASGTLVLARHGDVSLPHLAGAIVGLCGGSFLGARFTRRAPRSVLRVAVVLVPVLAGSLLLFG